MEMFTTLSQAASIELLDGIGCAFLAGAASLRAHNLGAPFAGAAILGCLCGISGPLAREVYLHGAEGTRLILVSLADEAFIGALFGLLAVIICKWRHLFFCIDRVGIALASTLATVLTIGEIGVAAALITGMISGLLPGLIRDVSLGDTALFIDKKWYAATCAIGCVSAVFINIFPLFFPACEFMEGRIVEWSALGGAVVTLGLDKFLTET